MKFKYKFNIYSYIILFILLAAMLTAVIYNIFRMSGHFGELVQAKMPIDLFSSIVMLIMIVIIFLYIFNSYFKISDNSLNLILGIIVVKYEFTDIVQIRLIKDKDLLLLYYKDDKKEIVKYIKVFIDKSQYSKFIESVREKNTNIVYDEIDTIGDLLNDK